MNKENDILKWFEGEISTEKMEQKYPDEDFSTLKKAGFYAKQIETPKIDAEKALEQFKTRSFHKKETKVVSLNTQLFLKIAAILVLIFGVSYFFFFSNTEVYRTEIAQTETLFLPDNSEVVLNAQSKLNYNKKEWQNNRTLKLNGEAFFKVTKGNKFTVLTNSGSIQVLGTQFNVKERERYFEVQCYEGSVSVTYQQNKTILLPGKSFRVLNGKVVSAKDFNNENPSWLAQETTFENVPLWQVINELEIQYNIKIEAKTVDVTKMFTGSFTHTNQNIALQSVTIPLKLSYKIQGDKVEFYDYETK
ncbi:FecR family protein [Wenyingzhuangia aestuarii]|uniref:FecR family protein n=1 Tax=Wenyingzhuangia aestuarii TaxID=1647582 RepID=UPI00143B051C|nr:FecR family protein [Wenyingzhuangia aestuarii]NJB83374.1 ferric-dicitrate binding protein FerR (iron transport regulator) [Wenyingzhuangia aestuarii]